MNRFAKALVPLLSMALLTPLASAQVNDGSNWHCGNNPAWNCTVDVYYEGGQQHLIVQNIEGVSSPVQSTPSTGSTPEEPAADASQVATCPGGKQYKAANGWLFRKVNGRWWPMGKIAGGHMIGSFLDELPFTGQEVTSLPTLVGVPAAWGDYR
jgi:hypothetical protein